MIKPTVGRKVWYRPSHEDLNVGTETTPPMQVSGDQPLDATVVAVWGDRLVNLVIFDVYGNQYARRSVNLLQDDDKRPDGGRFAEWMPYQVGQAKKESDPKIGETVVTLAASGSGTVELDSEAGKTGDWNLNGKG